MLFMVSTIIVLTSRFWGINTSLSMRYFIMAIWDLYFMLSYFSYREMVLVSNLRQLFVETRIN